MQYAIYAVLIVVLLLVSVAIHEAGHLLTAKRFGMKATEFFVGFGPRLFSFRRGETEYGMKLYPVGGYVKIIGMSPLENHDGTRSPEEIEDAAAAMAELPTDLRPDERRLFYTYPARQRTVVLAAGSLTHFVLAVVLTFIAVGIGGDFTQAQTAQPVFEKVSACATPADDGSCPAGSAPSPAEVAGFRKGDRITAVDGVAITSYDQLASIIKASAGKQLTIAYLRDGKALSTRATPVAAPALDKDGKAIPGSSVGRLGISPVLPDPPAGFGTAVRRTFPALGFTLKSTGTVITHLPGEVGDILTGKKRDATTSAVSVVGVVRATGSVGADKELGTKIKITNLVFTAAQLNLFVGIVNLLPLLPLDGGHIAILWYEKARAFVARRRRRSDPGRVNILKVLPAAYTAFGLIVLLSAILIYADIANPIKVT